MIPYDIDPSLHAGEPEPQLLDDGFSPRPQPEDHADADAQVAPADTTLSDKSAF